MRCSCPRERNPPPPAANRFLAHCVASPNGSGMRKPSRRRERDDRRRVGACRTSGPCGGGSPTAGTSDVPASGASGPARAGWQTVERRAQAGPAGDRSHAGGCPCIHGAAGSARLTSRSSGHAPITETRDASGDAVADRPGGRLGATAGIDLAVEVADVALDGVDRDAEARRDLAVGLAGGEQAQDLDLARGQPAARRPARGSRPRRARVRRAPSPAAAQPGSRANAVSRSTTSSVLEEQARRRAGQDLEPAVGKRVGELLRTPRAG